MGTASMVIPSTVFLSPFRMICASRMVSATAAGARITVVSFFK
jgi:hypothetical protein